MATISNKRSNGTSRTRAKPLNEDLFVLCAAVFAAAVLLAFLMPASPQGLNMLQRQLAPAGTPDVVIRVDPDRKVADTQRAKLERDGVQPAGSWQ